MTLRALPQHTKRCWNGAGLPNSIPTCPFASYRWPVCGPDKVTPPPPTISTKRRSGAPTTHGSRPTPWSAKRPSPVTSVTCRGREVCSTTPRRVTGTPTFPTAKPGCLRDWPGGRSVQINPPLQSRSRQMPSGPPRQSGMPNPNCSPIPPGRQPTRSQTPLRKTPTTSSRWPNSAPQVSRIAPLPTSQIWSHWRLGSHQPRPEPVKTAARTLFEQAISRRGAGTSAPPQGGVRSHAHAESHASRPRMAQRPPWSGGLCWSCGRGPRPGGHSHHRGRRLLSPGTTGRGPVRHCSGAPSRGHSRSGFRACPRRSRRLHRSRTEASRWPPDELGAPSHRSSPHRRRRRLHSCHRPPSRAPCRRRLRPTRVSHRHPPRTA